MKIRCPVFDAYRPACTLARGTPVRRVLAWGALTLGLCACVGQPPAEKSTPDAITEALRDHVKTIVVIYAENRAFDNLFGRFPGARGLGEVLGTDGRALPAYHPQLDRDGSVLPQLPPTWNGVTAPGFTPVISEAQSRGLPNVPFAIEAAFTASSGEHLSVDSVTRDLNHRFFENQMQIDGGKNDQFAAWSDAGGLTMGYYDYSRSAIYALAERYVLADNFFQGAFGGSFLNHQYLICACAPVYPDAETAPAKPSVAVLERDASGGYLPRLKTTVMPAPSALARAPMFVKSGNLAPPNYFGDGKSYAVNTMQPPYQPSGNVPASDDIAARYADPVNATTMPPQSNLTIGDLLVARRVSWAWYSGSWNAALADSARKDEASHKVIYAPETPGGDPDFQPHHQPFNYYLGFDPLTHQAERRMHLKDYEDFQRDIAAGRLPQVVFYKPQGNLNQHPGYATIAAGDAHLAQIVARLQAGPQWPHMVIVITYDEFGGAWDHLAPPVGDLLGPGTRIPALIISPYAKRHFVDHTQYDTGSTMRLVTRRFGLDLLPGLARRDAALISHGGVAMGDLTQALDFSAQARSRN